jgi:DNA invertase Pin-like site-specific DNA recombinase
MARKPLQDSSKARAVGYIRVSTDEQALEGVSLAAQEERIHSYCHLRGLELLEVIVDAGVSAAKPLAQRKGGIRLLSMLHSSEANTVVAFKLDRIFRNCAECLNVVEDWDKANIALHLIDLGGQAVDISSAMGRFFLTVMAGAAELERNQIRERTSMALQFKASKGEYCGGEVPYGFTKEGDKLSINSKEQETIKLAKELNEKEMSLRAISRILGAKGFVARNGKPFAAIQIQRMVA